MDHAEDATTIADCRMVKILCVDGGWLMLNPALNTPLACPTPISVIRHLVAFLSDDYPLDGTIRWTQPVSECALNSTFDVSKVDGGLLCIRNVPGAQLPWQAVRFAARDVLLHVGEWLGIRESPTES